MSEHQPDTQKKCQGCGGAVDPAAKYCPFCGATLNAATTTPAAIIQDKCPNCGEPRLGKFCAYCGYQFFAEIEIPVPMKSSSSESGKPTTSSGSEAGGAAVPSSTTQRSQRPVNRISAGVLALLLGTIGAQKFYMGKRGAGIACIIFCWTLVPTIIGICEGVLFLTATDEEFRERYLK
nr:NINE protein [Candidatus Sigynarchaeota archaeon]